MSERTVETLSEDPVLLRAAEWFGRFQHADLGVEEVAQWQRWMNERAEHREAFEKIQATWQLLDSVPPPGAAPDDSLRTDKYVGDISVAEWRRKKPYSRRRIHALAASVLVVIGAAALWKLIGNIHSEETIVFETQAGEHRDARLPDGSELSIGGRSLVWIDYSAHMRRVVLDRGEAFFSVARDKERPFQVRAGGSTITALGTAFNVRRSGERIVVSVATGAVQVAEKEKAGDEVKLAAGEQLIVEAAVTGRKVSRNNPETVSAWRTGRLQYLGEPLKYVVADVNRYSTRQIEIGDPAVGELLVSGTVFENDIEGWLRSLQEILPVEVERKGAGAVVLTTRGTDR